MHFAWHEQSFGVSLLIESINIGILVSDDLQEEYDAVYGCTQTYKNMQSPIIDHYFVVLQSREVEAALLCFPKNSDDRLAELFLASFTCL